MIKSTPFRLFPSAFLNAKKKKYLSGGSNPFEPTVKKKKGEQPSALFGDHAGRNTNNDLGSTGRHFQFDSFSSDGSLYRIPHTSSSVFCSFFLSLPDSSLCVLKDAPLPTKRLFFNS